MTAVPLRASFHDPDGSVFLAQGRVLRALRPQAAARLATFLNTPTCRELHAAGQLPGTRQLLPDEGPSALSGQVHPDAVWFEHERLPFINYPHEWLPEQLSEAGRATLAVTEALRSAGWDLKDGNVRNVIFNGLRPVFVDHGSMVLRDDAHAVWRPAGQLQRHVLLPLLLRVRRGTAPAALLLARPDGVSHAEAYAALAGCRYTDSQAFWLCTLPALLGRRGGGIVAQTQFTPEVCRAAADRTVRSLRKRLAVLESRLPPPHSHWSGYEASRQHYSADQLAVKRRAIERMLKRTVSLQMLDIGTNGGEYSNVAASLGHRVVSIDNDSDALSAARHSTRAASLDVLHLIVDFASPTPALGWNGAECQSFDQRCEGAFDLVMGLAVMHHILVSGGIPLQEMVAKLARYTRRELIIEYVDPSDPKFAEIAAQRGLNFSSLNRTVFETAVGRHFRIEEQVEIVPQHRCLYRCARLAA